MKTLTLVAAASTRPERNVLLEMENADEYPRASLFGKVLNSDILDEHFLEKTTGLKRKIYDSLPTAYAQLLEAYFNRKKYDAVISWAEHLGLPFALMLQLTGQKVPHVTIFSWISKPKKAKLLKRVQSRIDTLVLMSSIQYDFALNTLHIPASRVRLLKWPVDQKFWRPMNVADDMICSVGREMRDYGTLLQAMEGLDIRCHIAANATPGKTDAWQKDLNGDGTSTRSNITVGKKSYSELRDLYAHSRFVVVPLFPTDTDNGTTTVLEAMAMGKAVICTRVKGQADVIQEGKTGIFVPPNDPRALREAIEFLWNNPAEARRMGEDARHHIEKFHTLDGWIQTVKEIVEQAIGNNTRHHIFQHTTVIQ